MMKEFVLLLVMFSVIGCTVQTKELKDRGEYIYYSAEQTAKEVYGFDDCGYNGCWNETHFCEVTTKGTDSLLFVGECEEGVYSCARDLDGECVDGGLPGFGAEVIILIIILIIVIMGLAYFLMKGYGRMGGF